MVVVDPDHAHLQLLRHAVRPRDVAGPDRRTQGEGGVVGLADRVVLVVEGDDDDDRPEDLLLGNPHVVADVGQHRRLDEEATGQARDLGGPAAGDQAGALGDAALDVPEDARAGPLGDDRAKLGLGQRGVADPDLLCLGGERVDDLVVDAALHQQPAPGDAGLPGTDESGEGRAASRRVDRGVVEDEDGGLPAELQGGLGEASRGGDGDRPAHLRATGEDHLLDQRVLGQGRACGGAEPVDDIEHARRDARVRGDVAQEHGSERGLLRGLEHHAVPGRQRGRQAL